MKWLTIEVEGKEFNEAEVICGEIHDDGDDEGWFLLVSVWGGLT